MSLTQKQNLKQIWNLTQLESQNLLNEFINQKCKIAFVPLYNVLS